MASSRVVDDQMSLSPEALVQAPDRVVGCRRERSVDVCELRSASQPRHFAAPESEEGRTHQRIALLDSKLSAEEDDDGLELVPGRYFEHVVLHYWRGADRLEPHDDCTSAVQVCLQLSSSLK